MGVKIEIRPKVDYNIREILGQSETSRPTWRFRDDDFDGILEAVLISRVGRWLRRRLVLFNETPLTFKWLSAAKQCGNFALSLSVLLLSSRILVAAFFRPVVVPFVQASDSK